MILDIQIVIEFTVRQFKGGWKALSMEDIPKSGLQDICDVKIDVSLPGDLRMSRYVEQIRNPYCFLCDGTPVQVSFVNEEQELTKALAGYFSALKR